MPPPNTQIGVQFARKTAPVFEGYRIKSGTWKPVNQTEFERIKDENTERVMHHSFYGGDVLATCEMYQLAGAADVVEGQVITDNEGKGWVIEKADVLDFGTRAARFAVSLFYGEDEDTTSVS
jgi:hypothetical protein